MRLRAAAPFDAEVLPCPQQVSLTRKGTSTTMKDYDFSTFVRASMLALCLSVLASGMAAFAQTNTNNASTGANTPRTVVREDDDTDWGWIGLLGLAGLAGLMPKKRAVEVHDREPNRSPNR